VLQKTILIQEVDEDCDPIENKFSKVVIESDADLRQTFEGKASALVKIFDPANRITKFKHLENGEKYRVYSRYEMSYSKEVSVLKYITTHFYHM
jgi:hypothetical protein